MADQNRDSARDSESISDADLASLAIPARGLGSGPVRGSTIGRYVVLYELGSGGMGVVYAAYDPELDRKVALKLLHADSKSSRGRRRLLREAKAIAKLNHPNVVTVHDVGTFEGRVFVAMEWIDGVTLRQWLRDQPRPWRLALDVASAAGEGLAAAHAADLIHRDFKPDNILVEPNGRVVVLDFGLARRPQSGHDSGASANSDSEIGEALFEEASPPRGPGALDENLTRTGAVLGTPAYMAPEQHLGESVDTRCDQFAFCVVLWEALYGVRPFAGDNARITAMAVVAGEIQEPPRGTGVPNWIRRVLQRGLSVRADDRYADMAQLIAALRGKSTRTLRQRLALAAGIFGASAGASIAWAAFAPDDERCETAAEHLVGVWDDERRAAVRTAFADTPVPYANTARMGVEHYLDRYAQGWAREHRAACRATHVHREQSQEQLDRRMGCLRARLRDVEALVGEFVQADADLVEHAVEATVRLPRVDTCNDGDGLVARVLPPDEGHARKEVERVRGELVDASAKEAAGRYAAALELAERLEREAVATGYRPLLAEVRLRLGSLLERRGQFEEAEHKLLDAIWQAEASQHDTVAAEAWVRLLWVTGVEREDTVRGELWQKFAQTARDRLGHDDLLTATLTHNTAGLRYRQGRHVEAFEDYRTALAAQERLLGSEDPAVAMTYNHMGNVKIEQGDFAAAREYCTRSLELRRKVLGDRHPKVAASLNNLAVIAVAEGNVADAEAFTQEALTIVGGHGGSEETVAVSVAAEAADDRGDAVAGARHYQRLLQLREQERPTIPARVAEAAIGLGRARTRLGDHAAAGEALAHAIELADPGHPLQAANSWLALAELERARGREGNRDEALARARELAARLQPADAALDARLVAER